MKNHFINVGNRLSKRRSRILIPRILLLILGGLVLCWLVQKIYQWRQDSIVSSRMVYRIDHLNRMCEQSKMSTAGNTMPSNYVGSLKYGTAWCGGFSSLSNSWLHRWNTGCLRTNEKCARTNDGSLPAEQITRFVILAQHPFGRLVDIFENHIHQADERSDLFVTRMTISYKYRKGNFMPKLTFQEYINYIVERSQQAPVNVEYFFQPIHTVCSPCQYRFNAIVDASSYYYEESYVFRHFNLSNVMRPYRWLPLITEHQIAQRFANISSKQRKALYNFYRKDFELFGYDVDKYI
ncbi:carbohydrate sulfotransferase 11-like [Topomyia yanbarensis]|uniref:carbohydrate sulfotransferase 11-like n=1 Tax=Topomyia yanbarensis TaxID=2498891 RepID=UPI00273B734E|nr:carbohydrate sulfotransferase 11-like [Topomyia yanbarensis]